MEHFFKAKFHVVMTKKIANVNCTNDVFRIIIAKFAIFEENLLEVATFKC